jgi:adenine nucleotide transporter 17
VRCHFYFDHVRVQLISDVTAVALLYPLILAKTRLQAATPTNSSKKISGTSALAETIAGIHNRSGTSGLYQGLEAQLLKAFVNQGVSFLIKER